MNIDWKSRRARALTALAALWLVIVATAPDVAPLLVPQTRQCAPHFLTETRVMCWVTDWAATDGRKLAERPYRFVWYATDADLEVANHLAESQYRFACVSNCPGDEELVQKIKERFRPGAQTPPK